ncbi:MAG: ribonuclease H-like domain-containing protein, partial [Deltaproteobacteria bacterium]|nr:ribonuclease H-like domain-containing protein [Deltaproteobacteria bacterium]
EEMLFVDIETMGLFHGNMIFLIGAGFQDDKGLHIEQFFASSGGEEKAILSAFNGKAAGMKCYVSFCGAHFDIPFIRQRSAYYGIRMPPDHFHFDLYRFANRLWRGILPDCRLETIGTMALGERRSSVDIPSSLVPHHYQMFLRTGNASHIRPVLEHNRMDIAVMFRLYNKLAEIFV